MIRSVRVTKRVIDIVASTVGLGLTLPFYPVVAAAIRLESKGPVFFRQKRAGKLIEQPTQRGDDVRFQEFEMLKFRTMHVHKQIAGDPTLAGENDPRITKFGKIMRKLRIDELPQFWNVLKGDMSLIGPRPERPDVMRNLASAIPYYEERARGLAPGITGLAQISLGYTGRPLPGSPLSDHLAQLTNPFKVEEAEGALADDMRMKLMYDLAYSAQLESFWTFARTELSIVLGTPLIMLRGVGR